MRAIGRVATPEVLALDRRGISLEDAYRIATGRDPDAPDNANELARFVDSYRANYSGNPTPGLAYDGVHDTLTRLRARYPAMAIAVATTKRTAMAVKVVERTGLAHLFDRVQGSDGIPEKPDPTLLRVVASALDRPLAQAAMVGDTDHDIRAARAAGCIAIGVTYGGWGERMRSLAGAGGAHHVIDQFAELEPLVDALSPASSRE